MKKILIFGLKDDFGGLEKVVLGYSEMLLKLGLQCDFVIFGKKFLFEEELCKKGGKIFYLPSKMRSWKAYNKKMNDIFKAEKYDAVWANYSGLTNIDMLKLAKKYRIPKRIAHSHVASLVWSGWLARYLVPLFHYMNKSVVSYFATDFWACSKKAGEFMFPKKVHKKITVINNALDTELFYPDKQTRDRVRKELNIENNFVISHIARMCEDKNQLFMLDVFCEVLKNVKNAKLLFVGDGELRDAIFEKAETLGIKNNIIFTGFKNNVADYYKSSDVFLFPSISEGLGLSLIEAQACGVPCVASAAVPKEADVTECVKFINLDAPADTWAQEIIKISHKEICNATEKIIKANYDIKAESKKIFEFFISGA